MRPNGTYTLGSCDKILKGIYISEGLSRKEFEKVLCHELAHAAMYSYNVDLNQAQKEFFAELTTDIINIFIQQKREELI